MLRYRARQATRARHQITSPCAGDIEFDARLRSTPPEAAYFRNASGSMSYKARSTDCSRQEQDVPSMTVAETQP
jgi:hypothetical protein